MEEHTSKQHEQEIAMFAETNFRNQRRRFGIRTDDRRRHMYVIGKTGMGKTTMLENMMIQDIQAGHGIAVVDPHGDSAEKLLDFIPLSRINDLVYFNPADMEYPMGFNILETVDEGQKHLVASGLMGVFKKIWPDVWSARMEYILNNSVLALLEYPGSTLLGINRMLSDDDYRRRVISKITDPVVKSFWQVEFAGYNERYRSEAVAPVQNKIGQFLSASIIRNIVAQTKSTINIREIMDKQKILILNLSKGRIGEDNSRLLGGMLITRIQLAAMERVDIPEEDRKDFYLYVDEFQNFATDSFANILSEARKYRLNLILAHQYIGQLVSDTSTKVRDAIFGNVGTIVTFRVGAEDSEFMEQEFAPEFTMEDLVNLAKYDIYLKLMINGISSKPFSATTLGPIAERMDSKEKVIRVSRERYAMQRSVIEEKILRWSGMGEGSSGDASESDGRVERSIAPPFGKRTLPTSPGRERNREGDTMRRNMPQSRGDSLAKVSIFVPTPERTKEKIDTASFTGSCFQCGTNVPLLKAPDPVRPVYCDSCQKKISGISSVNRDTGDMRNEKLLSPKEVEPLLVGDPTIRGISLSEAMKRPDDTKKRAGVFPASVFSPSTSRSILQGGESSLGKKKRRRRKHKRENLTPESLRTTHLQSNTEEARGLLKEPTIQAPMIPDSTPPPPQQLPPGTVIRFDDAS